MGDLSKPLSRKRAMLYMFFCALMWSTGSVLVKFIDANALVIAGFRSIIALPVLLLAFPPRTLRFTKKAFLIALTLAATGVLFVSATKLTTAANAIVLQYCSPVFIILINYFYFKERVSKADVLVSAGCIAGMTLFFFDKLSPGNMLGNLLAIISGITNGALFVLMNRTTEDRGAISVAAQLEAIAISLPFFFLYPPSLTIQSVSALIALGAVQRGFSTILYSRASRYCSAMDAILISMAEPLVSPLLVMLFFHEKPGKFALAGCCVVIVSVLLWNVIQIKNANTDEV